MKDLIEEVPLVEYRVGERIGVISVGALSDFTGIPNGTLAGAKSRGDISGHHGYIYIDLDLLRWLSQYKPAPGYGDRIRWDRIVDLYITWEPRVRRSKHFASMKLSPAVNGEQAPVEPRGEKVFIPHGPPPAPAEEERGAFMRFIDRLLCPIL